MPFGSGAYGDDLFGGGQGASSLSTIPDIGPRIRSSLPVSGASNVEGHAPLAFTVTSDVGFDPFSAFVTITSKEAFSDPVYVSGFAGVVVTNTKRKSYEILLNSHPAFQNPIETCSINIADLRGLRRTFSIQFYTPSYVPPVRPTGGGGGGRSGPGDSPTVIISNSSGVRFNIRGI